MLKRGLHGAESKFGIHLVWDALDSDLLVSIWYLQNRKRSFTHFKQLQLSYVDPNLFHCYLFRPQSKKNGQVTCDQEECHKKFGLMFVYIPYTCICISHRWWASCPRKESDRRTITNVRTDQMSCSKVDCMELNPNLIFILFGMIWILIYLFQFDIYKIERDHLHTSNNCSFRMLTTICFIIICLDHNQWRMDGIHATRKSARRSSAWCLYTYHTHVYAFTHRWWASCPRKESDRRTWYIIYMYIYMGIYMPQCGSHP